MSNSSKYTNGFYHVGDTDSTGKKLTSSTVGAANEANARALQYSVGMPTSAQIYGLTSRDDYSVKDKYNQIKASKTGGSTGGSTGSTGSTATTGTTSTGTDTASYLASLYEQYAAQRQAALENAYNNAKANINSGYDEASSLLGANYNSAKSAVEDSYKNSRSNIQSDASKSLKEAYINKVLSQKNLAQQLAAQGLSGGASETTMANLLNSYGNSRNEINDTLATNLANLNSTRNQNLASILQNYNSNLANLQQQKASALANIESALASGIADGLDNQYSFQTSGTYLQALQDAVANMNAYSSTPTSATNTVNNVNTAQTGIDNITANTNYEEYIEKLLAALSGATA